MFVALFYILKGRNTKIVWTMHNKLSHYNTHYYSKSLLFKFVLMRSDYILTHSSEGIRYASEFNFKHYERMRYFPHPIEDKIISFHDHPTYDILIWGSIIPYKGIDKFLEFLYNNNLENKYRILICGKVKPDSYESVITGFCNDKIKLENRYVPEEDLKVRIADSRFVVFTYIGDSVISSGVLMDTLSYGGYVLAPHIGAFKDAAEDDLIETFETYDDLIRKLDERLKATLPGRNKKTEQFIVENSWSEFARKMIEWIA
jgi:glycosyltransferase involved in cell wall biosynthesis